MAEQITSAWPGFKATPRTFLTDSANQIAVLVSLTGSGVAMDMVELWTVVDEKITKCQPFYFDAALAAQTAKDNQP